MKNLDPSVAQHYSEKADQFFGSMKVLWENDFREHRASIALLAVHSAISLNDAIQTALTGKRSKYENHAQTIKDLKSLCNRERVREFRGIDHFKWLLGQKSKISYGDERIDDELTKAARDKAERFR